MSIELVDAPDPKKQGNAVIGERYFASRRAEDDGVAGGAAPGGVAAAVRT